MVTMVTMVMVAMVTQAFIFTSKYSNTHFAIAYLMLPKCCLAILRASTQLSPAAGCATTIFTTARHVGSPNRSTL